MINLLDYKKILLLLYGGSGDCVLMTPFIKNLRKFVGNEIIIDVVSNFKNKLLIENNPNVNNFICATHTEDGDCEIFNRYDCVIDLLVSSVYRGYIREALMKSNVIKYGINYQHEAYKCFNYYIDINNQNIKNEIDSSLRLLKAANVPIVDTELDFFFPKDFVTPSIEELDCLDFSKTIAVAPFGSDHSNSYIHVNDVLNYIINNTKYNVVLFGLSNRCYPNFKFIDNNRIINTIDKFDIFTYAYYLSKCFACISTSSLSSHLASCFKVPIVYLNPRIESNVITNCWDPYNIKSVNIYARITNEKEIGRDMVISDDDIGKDVHCSSILPETVISGFENLIKGI